MDINQILANASKIIQRDANGELDAIANKARKNGAFNSFGLDEEGMPKEVMQESATPYMDSAPQVTTQGLSKSKLPKEIIDSFKSTPSISTSPITEGHSILDTMNIQIEKPSKVNAPIVEDTVRHQVMPNTKPTSNGIDYEMVKMIVENSLKKYMGALKKSLLTEAKQTNSSSQLQAMKIGDKFSFIDNDGNLFEAKLTFIKNINSKK